ncbi:MAG: PH domain-containing protein [Oscillospiraceae bacterium]
MAKLVSKIVELWHDRKRILGMPLSFTRYALSEDRLFLRRGFLNVHQDEIVLYRVRDLRVSQTLWQRIFGVGTVTVISTDKSIPELALKNIRQPNEVKELIHEYVEKMKIERRMRVGEMSMDFDGDDAVDFEDNV